MHIVGKNQKVQKPVFIIKPPKILKFNNEKNYNYNNIINIFKVYI